MAEKLCRSFVVLRSQPRNRGVLRFLFTDRRAFQNQVEDYLISAAPILQGFLDRRKRSRLLLFAVGLVQPGLDFVQGLHDFTFGLGLFPRVVFPACIPGMGFLVLGQLFLLIVEFVLPRIDLALNGCEQRPHIVPAYSSCDSGLLGDSFLQLRGDPVKNLIAQPQFRVNSFELSNNFFFHLQMNFWVMQKARSGNPSTGLLLRALNGSPGTLLSLNGAPGAYDMSCNSILLTLLQSGQRTERASFPSRSRILTGKVFPHRGHLICVPLSDFSLSIRRKYKLRLFQVKV